MRYKLRDNAAKGEFYKWISYDEFKPSSIGASGDGFVTNKIDTPVDSLDTVLIQYKEPKASSESLASELKTAVLEHLKEIAITEKSISSVDHSSAMIKTDEKNADKVKLIAETYISKSQGATITII